ncbi:L-threonylcarbamoyladenylate synthase [uncultured Alistipes sp.]|uniref:L-threonylcarbamoyladenylate synthase n=1 Tax=uncultured Alistipes sp. TaxID=538949 RepID=UPI00263176EF|nr:L-threonylcarbamoyladenylate synthase [uncultured Alistipes sp.]
MQQTKNKLQQEVEATVEVLRKGGIILYPTDTVWGIGCDATDEEAVARIYALKRSENKKSMLVLCGSADMAVRYVNRAPGIAFEVQEMATSPLTLILPGATGVAPNLIPEEGTLGIRIPDHEFCHEVLRRFNRPIVSTSANISGEPAPKRLPEIAREIIDGVDYVVDPRFEGHPTGKPSSIIAFTEEGGVKIIRQ